MDIAIYGAGYVGLVTAACFAETGNHVRCVDIDEAKIACLRGGSVPIAEPGLAPLVRRNQAAGRLEFMSALIDLPEVVVIAVGTPPRLDGSAELDHVLDVAATIGRLMRRATVIVQKSTVPVGTAEQVRRTVADALRARGAEHRFAVVANPEFLKQGAAVADFMAFMAFGTQTLGSVIRPASYCGCVGYKPSYGEVSASGVKENTASFDTVGLFGRSVEDLPRFRAAATGAPLQPLAPVAARDLRIGLCRTLLWDRAQDYAKALVEGAAARLAGAGAKVSDLDLGGPFADFETMGRRVSEYEIARALSWERNRCFHRLSEFQQGKLADWPRVSYEEYREGERVVAACRAYLEEASRDFDAILTPSATGEAPEGLDDTGDTSFNILATWTHAPCVTLPVFEGPTGLPVGLQVVGRRCRDHRLFEVSRAVLRALSEQGPRPQRAEFA